MKVEVQEVQGSPKEQELARARWEAPMVQEAVSSALGAGG